MDDISVLEREAAATPMHGVWIRGGPVYSKLSDAAVHALEGRAIASFGDAATLGLWAFATGLLFDGLFQIGVLPLHFFIVIFPILIVYPGAALFIAGLMLYRRNDTFFGSTFCSFGAFHLSRGILVLSIGLGLPSTAATEVQGVMMEVFAYIALSLAIGALRFDLVMVLMLSLTSIGCLLSGPAYLAQTVSFAGWQHMTIGANGLSAHADFRTIPAVMAYGADVVSHSGWRRAAQVGGGFLLAGCAFGYYGGTALLVNTAWRRVVVPLGGKA
jgi:uncharacterized protein